MGRGMQILIVEDDSVSRHLLSRYLECFGDCDVAINGDEAVRAVEDALSENQGYDLICLDIMMPGLSGQETLKEIRRLESQHNLAPDQAAKIIMTTSIEDSHTMREAFSASADGYVVKPLRIDKFLTTVQDLGLQPELTY